MDGKLKASKATKALNNTSTAEKRHRASSRASHSPSSVTSSKRMASAKLYLIHIQEIAKKSLEEEKKQTKLLIVVLFLVVLNMILEVMLMRS